MCRHVLVVGGGAAGMAAAIAAAREGARATVAERLDRVGKKLLATGNGRCNLSNTSIEASRYHSAADSAQILGFAKKHPGGVEAAMRVLLSVGADFVSAFFESLGVLTAIEGRCRVYPRTFMASTVLDALRAELARLGVEERCWHEAVAVDALPRGGFETRFADGRRPIRSDAVVVATGGRAAPNLGTDGGGYALLARHGHRLLEPSPALVPIMLAPGCVRGLKGVRVNARAALVEAMPAATPAATSAATPAATHAPISEEGEFLFTEYGISGIPAMDLSTRLECLRRARGADLRGGAFALSVDLFPEYSEAALSELILDRMGLYGGIDDAQRALAGFLHKRVARLAATPAMGSPAGCGSAAASAPGGIAAAAASAPGGIAAAAASTPGGIAAALKRWMLPIVGTLGFDRAQATLGGIDLSGFYTDSLESRLVPGLHAAGEALDVVGDCGGFNLHWAWASGYAAGQGSAEELP